MSPLLSPLGLVTSKKISGEPKIFFTLGPHMVILIILGGKTVFPKKIFSGGALGGSMASCFGRRAQKPARQKRGLFGHLDHYGAEFEGKFAENLLLQSAATQLDTLVSGNG